jgi:hypothetical protein
MSDNAKTSAKSARVKGIIAHLLQFWPDFYGERSFFSPRYRPKTSLGGCVSLCFFVVISLLFAYTWVEFFGSGYFLSVFGTLHANSLVAVGVRQEITALRNAILPTLSLYISAESRSSRVRDLIATTIMQSPTHRASSRHLVPEFVSVHPQRFDVCHGSHRFAGTPIELSPHLVLLQLEGLSSAAPRIRVVCPGTTHATACARMKQTLCRGWLAALQMAMSTGIPPMSLQSSPCPDQMLSLHWRSTQKSCLPRPCARCRLSCFLSWRAPTYLPNAFDSLRTLISALVR